MDLPHRLYHGETERLFRDLLVVDAGGTVDFGVPGTILPDDAAAEGAAATAARSDHQHAITAAVAGAATPGDAAAEGSATSFARSDHKHALPAFGTGAGTFAEGNDPRFTNLVKVWDARAIPAGLHADSDEFPGGALNGAWGDFDHGAWLTNSVESNPGQLIIAGTHAADATVRLGGVYKAVPSTEFQFLAHCTLDCNMGGSSSATAAVALAVMQDATNSTGDLVTIHRSISNPDTSAVNTVARGLWSAYNAISSAVSFNTQYNTMWLRMRVSISGATTTVFTDWSSDGVHWVTVDTSGETVPHAVAHYGIVGGSGISGGTIRVTAQHFRVFSGAGSSAFNYVNNGNYLGS